MATITDASRQAWLLPSGRDDMRHGRYDQLLLPLLRDQATGRRIGLELEV